MIFIIILIGIVVLSSILWYIVKNEYDSFILPFSMLSTFISSIVLFSFILTSLFSLSDRSYYNYSDLKIKYKIITNDKNDLSYHEFISCYTDIENFNKWLINYRKGKQNIWISSFYSSNISKLDTFDLSKFDYK